MTVLRLHMISFTLEGLGRTKATWEKAHAGITAEPKLGYDILIDTAGQNDS